MLNELDIKLLEAIYEYDFNQITFDENTLGFESKHHLAHTLQRLKRLGFIEFDGEVIQSGGMRDEKYKVSVAMIWRDRIHITKQGINAIKQ